MLRHSAHSYFSKLQFLAVLFILLFVAAVMPVKPCQAGMQELADAEMSDVYATGFASFTWETVGAQDIARANFNIETKMYADIASAKMGYYEKTIGATTAFGWDQNWTGVKLGAPTTDLVAKGFYIEAGFETAGISGDATRTLNYIKIGTTDLTGPISASFNSLSWQIGTADPIYRDNLNSGAPTTITASNTGFYLSLNRSSGYLVHWDNAIVAPTPPTP